MHADNLTLGRTPQKPAR